MNRKKTVTPTQYLVLDMLKNGMSRTQIAAELSIRPDTVKDHVRGLRAKGLVGHRTRGGVVALRVLVDPMGVDVVGLPNG